MKRIGALPAQTLRDMIAANFIPGASTERVQPASLDLVIGEEAYRVRRIFQPRQSGDPVLEAAQALAGPEQHDLARSLEVGVSYLIRLAERLELPDGVYGYANPKSSAGRCDLHVRMLADGIPRFDSAGVNGFRGSLWALVTPRSFRVRISPGNSLLQLRLFNDDTRFRQEYELEVAHHQYQLVFTPAGAFVPYQDLPGHDPDGALVLTINLQADIVGYRCEGSQEVLDFSAHAVYDPLDFFRPIERPRSGLLEVRRGDFYILATNEFVRVPPTLAAEITPVSTRAGDFRAQYAGYFDPGWGHGSDGMILGAPAVLEVRAFEDNLAYHHGKAICLMTFERMAELPDVVYGETGSHYLEQRGPRLSKHFRQ